MAKKLFFVMMIAALSTGGVFAEEAPPVEASRAKNTAAVTVGLIGVEASYERSLTRNFSVLADVSYSNVFFVGDSYTAAIRGRWYPWGKTFFLDLGLGYGNTVGLLGSTAEFVLLILTLGLVRPDAINDALRVQGLLVAPSMGWKIDVGKPGGFVIPVVLGLDVVVGGRTDVVPYARVGVGFSF
ncbi:MAG: hypothetical protein LBC88_07615 [Spirochaetaceae bacterium]|jgi:hypothetical protein|nr:hypothetical protein [Spirochaetaceae bacterium]